MKFNPNPFKTAISKKTKKKKNRKLTCFNTIGSNTVAITNLRTLCIKPAPSEPFSLPLKADKAQQTLHRNNKNKPGESAKTMKIKTKALVIMLFFALGKLGSSNILFCFAKI